MKRKGEMKWGCAHSLNNKQISLCFFFSVKIIAISWENDLKNHMQEWKRMEREWMVKWGKLAGQERDYKYGNVKISFVFTVCCEVGHIPSISKVPLSFGASHGGDGWLARGQFGVEGVDDRRLGIGRMLLELFADLGHRPVDLQLVQQQLLGCSLVWNVLLLLLPLLTHSTSRQHLAR